MSEKGKPLQKERWAGVVDTAGSQTLANACAQTKYGGAVAACGLAQGADLPSTVMPFILRGVSLLGIDSVMAPKAKRLKAWARSEEHTSELQSLMRISYAVFCLKKKTHNDLLQTHNAIDTIM